ncbi:putative transposase [Sphingobium sp. SYK-6]|uniref:DDE-type integrase/transposase/recombinase n=1 Tax=Sphingobium sp. (strain NBRC 103272 / SYK-6) TaxID=627192 RepID=UPI00022770CE|nr:putative transposase [Sphingobium sp. SYK-6]
MLIKLHRNATTTPRQRAYIQASDKSVADLARELGVNQSCIRRWKGRRDTMDRPSTPHRLMTRFSTEEEDIAVELRSRLALSLDDALEVMRRCLRADISRAALYRLWRRHGIAAPRTSDQGAGASLPFDPAPFGYVHADLKHLPRLLGKPAYVLVVIERATRFVHVDILDDRSAATLAAAFERFLKAFSHPVHTVLTDNGSEFTDRFGGAYWGKRNTGTGRHAFDQVCAAHGIKHKLTRPYHPQTNGMVERFNRRISQAIAAHPANNQNAGRNHFSSHQERNSFIRQFVNNYNRTRLRCLAYHAPAQQLAILTKHNTCAGMTEGRKNTVCVPAAEAPSAAASQRAIVPLRATNLDQSFSRLLFSGHALPVQPDPGTLTACAAA